MQSTVLSCGADECAYNKSSECHAPSVSIGSEHPSCDTFTESGMPQEKAMPEVAACHIDECQFNQEMACRASGITVASHERHADCGTFSLR